MDVASDGMAAAAVGVQASGRPVPRVQTLGKAIDILLAVARSRGDLKAMQIVRSTGLAKQATHHLLHSLVTIGLLQKTDGGGYVLGPSMGELATAYDRQFEPPSSLLQAIRGVAQETGETAYVSGWWNREIVTLATARGTRVLQPADLRPGTYGHAHARASGKLLLALANEHARAIYLANHPLAPRTPTTITDPAILMQALGDIRRDGVASDLEEFAPDLCCLAVPVALERDVFALAVSWPTSRYERDRERYLGVLRRAVAGIG